MKAAVFEPPGKVVFAQVAPPALNGQSGAIVRVLGCGLCGSDIVKIKKNLVPQNTILGHEVVGIIDQIDSKTRIDLKKGDRVALAHHFPCGGCRYCQQGSFSMCKTFKSTNLIPGGFSEYVYVSDQHLKHCTIKVPDRVTDLNASLMEPLGCVLRAIERADITAGQNVLVVGLGFIGLLFIQALKGLQCNIIGCDIMPERINLAWQYGANSSLDSSNTNVVIGVIQNQIDFEGVDVVILASGANQTLELALKAVRDGGKIVIFASIPDEMAGFANNQVYYRELAIIGAYSSSPEHLRQAMKLIECGKIDMKNHYNIMPIEQINEAVVKTMNHTTLKVFLTL